MLSRNSFASNGECGLKPLHHPAPIQLHKNSFASNGECGLKPAQLARVRGVLQGNSFASNGECGLKPPEVLARLQDEEFIRQQWRMWIETRPMETARAVHRAIHSPAMANVD